MKKMLFLLLFAMQFNLYSQDSSALEFLRLYNKFRVENNLAPLEYSMELEEFAKERNVVVSKGLVDCFNTCDDPVEKCPDRDLHFKFIRMAENHYKDSNKRFIISFENASVSQQFECYPFLKPKKNDDKDQDADIPIDYSNKAEDGRILDDRIEYKAIDKELVKEKDFPLHFLNLWISSPRHKEGLLKKDITHFGFNYMDVYYQGNRWVQAYWIAGELKK